MAAWQADELRDVRGAIERVEACQRDGQYVVGFIAYEAAPAFDPAFRTPPRGPLPYAWFAAFHSPEPETPAAGTTPPVSLPRLRITETEYSTAVRQALDHIRAGDIYQVNYTVRAVLEFTAPGSTGKPSYVLFHSLRAAVPMPYAAFLDLGDAQIVSLSPELFLRRCGSALESRPMKGTAPRKPSWEADEAARLALSADEKNRAENVMIVDLMRNDLGRICRAGTVIVPELYRVDRFPTVHQMTSLVRGELPSNIPLWEIFTATFPPGSVTGAPKIRACEIIADLEPEPRGIYCGTIGLFFPNGDFVCNVAIRTLTINTSESNKLSSAVLGIGSGIVADSDPAAEWQETLLKASFVTCRPQEFSLYETIRFEPPRVFEDLACHLRRLRQSCRYFNRPFPIKNILQALRGLHLERGNQPVRIRLDLEYEDIRLQVEQVNLSWPEDGLVLMIPEERLNPDDFRLYHKTTLRPERYLHLEAARKRGAQECLFLNTRGELTEGALSNILVKIEGRWLTPALPCGLLPGVRREKLLRRGRCCEAILTVDDLARAQEIRMVNAVRGEGIVRRIFDARNRLVYASREP